MGGFTQVFLKDKTQKNIDEMNQTLKDEGVAQYSFYSENDIKLEYEAFKKDQGVFPEHSFPKEKINSYQDFTKYWSTRALGSVFCPEFGTLICDCYFGRMSQRAMNNLCKFIAIYSYKIEKVEGSWSTLVERGGKNWQIKTFKECRLL